MLSVAIPASFVGESDDPRIRTYKIGQVARAAAVYRCDRVVVYDDDPDDGDEIALVLRYAATAPYLRKEEFDVREELSHVGVVPPLGIPPHKAGSDPDGSEPEYRQGVVTKVGPDGRVWVNCGMQHPVALHVPRGIREGERVTLRVSSREPLRAEEVDSGDPEAPYTGYEVERVDLADWLTSFDGATVCTTRHGDEVSSPQELQRLRHQDVAVVFGSPDRGVEAILDGYYGVTHDFTEAVNTIPRQGTDTVRTEEAVWASMALVNVARMQDQI